MLQIHTEVKRTAISEIQRNRKCKTDETRELTHETPDRIHVCTVALVSEYISEIGQRAPKQTQ